MVQQTNNLVTCFLKLDIIEVQMYLFGISGLRRDFILEPIFSTKLDMDEAFSTTFLSGT